jgi:hypothetical protein
MSFGLGFWAAAGGGVAAATDYELIQTINITTTGITTIDLSSIPATYKHLQLRLLWQSNTNSSGEYGLAVLPNSDGSTTDNAFHWLCGNGGSVASTARTNTTPGNYGLIPYPQPQSTGQSINPSSYQSQFVAAIVDFVDYASTSKNKTIKTLSGFAMGGGQNITVGSMLWTDTSAINRLFMYCSNAPQFTVGSRFSLYGIKG